MYGRNRYKQARFETAQPGDLVVMLYDGIIRFVRDAARAMEEDDIQLTGGAIERALDIITYLHAVLDADKAPDVAKSLEQTYGAWSTLLVKARAERDVESLRAIGEQVVDLREAWVQVNQQAKGGGGGEPRSVA
ncbi:MAG: flagellar export chaperone FliS [Myxococcota bacterium]